jgi:hypothetical protein
MRWRLAARTLGMAMLLLSVSVVSGEAQQGQPRTFGGGAGRTWCSYCQNQYHAQMRQCEGFENSSLRSDCTQRAFDWAQVCERECVKNPN